MTSSPIEPTRTGVRLTLYLQPGASRTEFAGRHGGALKLRVQARPVDGAANQAAIRFLAERLDVPKHAVRLVAGAATRTKRFEIDEVSVAHVAERLDCTG
jgi:uncharacterized protein